MKINAKTQLNFVIGNPVRHSQSPALHQDLYQEQGINAVMLAIENPNLPDLVSSIKTLGVRLTAVTLPYKSEILKHVDFMSDEVKALGAANTLILSGGQLHAFNTDIDGIKQALIDVELAGKKVLILGAGGAARAAAYSLQDCELFYLNRSRNKADMLADQFGGWVIDDNELKNLNPDIIINATPVGMLPHNPVIARRYSDEAIPENIILDCFVGVPSRNDEMGGSLLAMTQETTLSEYIFQKNQIVFDMVYTPENTRLLNEASQAGAQTISGFIMLKAQAKKQIELAYGENP